MLVIDARWRLFVFAEPVRAVVVLAIGVVGFLLWDAAGIGLGIFFEGPSRLLLGLDVLPQVPVEEPVFLTLLCLSAMVSFQAATRRLGPGRPR